MSRHYINEYYNHGHSLKMTGVTNELAIKQPFDRLVQIIAKDKHYVYATEVTIKNEQGRNIRPDGILMNELRIHKGYVESKDSSDSLDEEINKKLYKDGYPTSNILFQDSVTAVLVQNGEEAARIEMKHAKDLEAILKQFLEYKPAHVHKFEDALKAFKQDIPSIVETLRELIEDQNRKNETYQKARDAFWEMCKQEINPQITIDDVREMVIQHILTEDLFRSVFDESDFHRENNVARELETLTNTFMSRTVRQNKLSELNHYYQTLNAQASMVADHHEKQKFLKVVYENFYKVYNPKGADRLGVVYTPNEIVAFMIRSTDYLLDKHFGRSLYDQNVHILDPATGTGTFITDMIEYIPPQYLEHKYKNEIHANEVAILPYYVANLNIEFTYKQRMGTYAEYPNICFVDTLDNTAALTWDRMDKDQGIQAAMFGGISSENAARIKNQNKQKISVVIGNPPWNAKQENYNYQNSNRAYERIDQRIKNTFIKYGTAQNQIVVYDMYTRFYRWAMDRIDANGVINFITNRSFIDSRAFDGFRKCIQQDFDYCYIIDTKSDVRVNPKISGTKNNVFGIQVGVAIMFLVRKQDRNKTGCQIYYNGEMEDDWLKEDKLEWLNHATLSKINFERIQPSEKNNWVNLSDNDFEELLPLIDKDVKAGKNKDAIFKTFSSGLKTQRDGWVYGYHKKHLRKKVEYLVDIYEKSRKDDKFKDKMSIKWDRELQKYQDRDISISVNESAIKLGLYRPFVKSWMYFDKHLNGMTYQWFEIWNDKIPNKYIAFSGIGSSKPFHALVSDCIVGLDTIEKTQCLPLYSYKDGSPVENITDWGLQQFQEHYADKTITKEDIFHYTYGVLHDPAYRKKYELNLKLDFPRLPFYEDFHQWATWGKQLMDLHIGYEAAKPYPLKRIDADTAIDEKRKLKVKLKADKEAGVIDLDEHTALTGIPDEAWAYKLGNRSALEWILDQYKEKKPRDQTIAEKFNTYRFADYKEYVIELLEKVTTVSLETVGIVREMESTKQCD